MYQVPQIEGVDEPPFDLPSFALMILVFLFVTRAIIKFTFLLVYRNTRSYAFLSDKGFDSDSSSSCLAFLFRDLLSSSILARIAISCSVLPHSCLPPLSATRVNFTLPSDEVLLCGRSVNFFCFLLPSLLYFCSSIFSSLPVF